VGDYVKVRSLGSTGHVVGMDREGKGFEVVIGNVRTKVDANLLEKVPKPKGASEKSSIQVHAEKVSVPEIKVIGMRVEEALSEIDRFLDRSIVQEIPQVKILHGIGTGRLMNAIREHLEDMSYIKSIKKDSANSGVTIIEFT
jgi:DNA mismatch repair protein MutS2